MIDPHPSVLRLWRAYCTATDRAPATPCPPAWHFCDNEADANELAALVCAGVKRATTPSVWELEAAGCPLPEPGDLNIVTTWDGIAQCIIRTTDVEVVSFDAVTAAHAAGEGEGDGSLAYWRRTHWAYYQRVLADTPHTPSPDMPVVCEHFEGVHVVSDAHLKHTAPPP